MPITFEQYSEQFGVCTDPSHRGSVRETYPSVDPWGKIAIQPALVCPVCGGFR